MLFLKFDVVKICNVVVEAVLQKKKKVKPPSMHYTHAGALQFALRTTKLKWQLTKRDSSRKSITDTNELNTLLDTTDREPKAQGDSDECEETKSPSAIRQSLSRRRQKNRKKKKKRRRNIKKKDRQKERKKERERGREKKKQRKKKKETALSTYLKPVMN